MSAGGGEGNSGDIDLNLAPIIDCFTVLITYLLVSASFLSLTVFDASIALNGPTSATEALPLVPVIVIVVEMKDARTMEIKAAGGATNIDVTMAVPLGAGGDYDWEVALAKIREFGQKYPLPKDITITAEPHVIYKDMIKAIESLRKVVPKVLMAG